MQTPTGESLLDEADFFAELATLEDGLTATRRSARPAENHAYEPLSGLPTPVWPRERPVPDAEPEHEAPPTLLAQVMAAAMFVLMMGVGAAGAAVVFHDRFARLVAALRI